MCKFLFILLIEVLNLIRYILCCIIYKNGTTALMIASYKDYFEIVKILIENNADKNIQNKVFFFLLLIFICSLNTIRYYYFNILISVNIFFIICFL
jgi:hypothetical protein